MCLGICCEVGRHGDEIRVWGGDPAEMSEKRDSHSEIRKFHNLPEITGTVWKRTPLEHYFKTGFERADQMERHFDEGRPDWWDADCDAAVDAWLQTEMDSRSKMERDGVGYPGYPKIIGDIQIPWRKIVGDLDAGAATSFSAPALVECNYLNVRAATSFSAPALVECGTLDVLESTKFNARKLKR